MYGVEFVGTDDQLAAAECAAAATDVTIVAPGLATSRGLTPGRFRGLAFGRSAIDLIARTTADVSAARTALESATLERSGSVAVRARNVRGTADISTQTAERELGAALLERGYTVDLEDPDHVLRAFFAEYEEASKITGSEPSQGNMREPASNTEPSPETPHPRVDVKLGDGSVCLVGWTSVESIRDFEVRSPTEKPFFVPGSMDPMVARALGNLALLDREPSESVVIDPLCGTAGGLIESGLLGADVIGIDADGRTVRGARRNMREYLDGPGSPELAKPGAWSLLQGDATRLPIGSGADVAVFEVPYGRQSRVAGTDQRTVVNGTLAAVNDLTDRAVAVSDRSLCEAARDQGWAVEATFRRRVHGSLVRHIHVLA